jgi:phosphoglycolate phosphatase
VACAIFDLDGTLIDSASDLLASASGVLAKHHGRPLELAEFRTFIGDGTWTLFLRAASAAKAELSEEAAEVTYREFLSEYDNRCTVSTRLYPECESVLRDLRGSGLFLGLCTNKREGTTKRILNHFGIAGNFSVIVGSDTLTCEKPDPDVVLHMVRCMGVAADLAVVIGDGPQDRELARRAGTRFVHAAYGYGQLEGELDEGRERRAYTLSDVRTILLEEG